MSKENRLLTEILRPKKFEQLIFSERIKLALNNGILSQNLLFHSTPGMGKTSAAKVMASKYPYIYINCSDETGVDTVRDKITKWCSTISVMDEEESIKVVILDELDGVSDSFFRSLRATIEKFAEKSRFIGTCNYFNKIPDAILSRFSVVNFDFIDKEEEQYVFDEQVKRSSIILKKLGIQNTSEICQELVKKSFPDMRRLLNKIQTFQLNGIKELTKDLILKEEWTYEEIFELCIKSPDPHANYTFLVSQYGGKVDEILASFGSEFPNWLNHNHHHLNKFLPFIIIETAQHQAQRVNVIDPVITLLSCVFRIQQILNQKS